MLTIISGKTLADFVYVPIEGVIDGGLAAFIDRTVTAAENESADGVIFHVNTPGGRIDSAVEIKDRILNAKIPHNCICGLKAQYLPERS